jgi:protein disulfide-isomerase A1
MLIISVLSLLFVSSLVLGDDDSAVDEKDVVVLTKDNFDTAVAEHEFVLVEFYAPWCGHCKRLTPEYAAAASALKADGIVLGKVDATVETDLGAKFEVRGYPTLKWFRAGKPTDYTGGRTTDEITQWCRKKSGPPTRALAAAADVADFVAGKNAVVGQFTSRDSAAYKAFVELAKDGDLDDFPFADVVGAADSITLHTSFAAPQLVPAGADAKQFILNNGYPVVDELPDAWERYSKKGLPLAILFIDPAADNKALLAEVTKAGVAVQDKVSFSYADGIRFKQQIERMGGNQEVVPQIAAMKLSGKANYPYTGALTAASLQKWAEGIADGSVQPHLKSEEIPTPNDGPVKVAVGKTINDYVNNADADVMLEIYAPWCGHCKTLAPIYEELGQKFAANPKVIIAKIDGTANDFDIEYRGFPTIKFFPAGGKAMDYEGGRDLESMEAFIKQNGKFAGGAESNDSKDEL